MSSLDTAATKLGLRERKKQQTRETITRAALRLFAERGYDETTLADIANAADVAPRTFFGYFETKEDVFLGPGDARLEHLARAIHDRDPGEPILAAVRRELLRARAASVEKTAPELADLLRHPAIANRLRERWNRWEDLLAEAIAADVGARPEDPEPRVVAAALTGAIRVAAAAMDEQPHRRDEIAERVFDLLAWGLSSYGSAADDDG